jgi:Tol biopolymer transport system component
VAPITVAARNASLVESWPAYDERAMRVAVLLALSGCSLYFSSDDSPVPDAHLEPLGEGSGEPYTPPPPDDVPPAPTLGACAAGLTPSGWIVFDSDRAQFNRDLFRIRTDGTGLERLTTTTSVDKDPAPSPDGTKIAFTSTRSGTLQIHLLDLSTNAVTQVTDRVGGAQEPSFSHDGARIAFRSGSSIYTIAVNGTNETFVADSGLDEYNAFFAPHFSIDDSEIFVDRNNEIRAIRTDTLASRYVVNNWTVMIKSPSPSPSGTALAFELNGGPPPIGAGIWGVQSAVPNDPGEGRRLTPAEAGADSYAPEWGPLDLVVYERVVQSSSVSSIVVVSTEPGSVPCQVTTDLYDNRNPAWMTEPL